MFLISLPYNHKAQMFQTILYFKYFAFMTILSYHMGLKDLFKKLATTVTAFVQSPSASQACERGLPGHCTGVWKVAYLQGACPPSVKL